MLESDIYILTELFQEEIQYYIYYETQNFEMIRQSLDEQVTNVILTMIVALASIITASFLMDSFGGAAYFIQSMLSCLAIILVGLYVSHCTKPVT